MITEFSIYTITATHLEQPVTHEIVAADEEEAVQYFCKKLGYNSYDDFIFYNGELKIRFDSEKPQQGLLPSGEFR